MPSFQECFDKMVSGWHWDRWDRYIKHMFDNTEMTVSELSKLTYDLRECDGEEPNRIADYISGVISDVCMG